MNIIIRPLGHGRYEAILDGRMLCSSSTPFFSTARILQREGTAHDTEITMKHQGASTISMKSTVGKAAALTVRENDHDDLSIVPYTHGPSGMPLPSVGVHQGQAFQSLR
jgi:hypothetical protein